MTIERKYHGISNQSQQRPFGLRPKNTRTSLDTGVFSAQFRGCSQKGAQTTIQRDIGPSRGSSNWSKNFKETAFERRSIEQSDDADSEARFVGEQCQFFLENHSPVNKACVSNPKLRASFAMGTCAPIYAEIPVLKTFYSFKVFFMAPEEKSTPKEFLQKPANGLLHSKSHQLLLMCHSFLHTYYKKVEATKNKIHKDLKTKSSHQWAFYTKLDDPLGTLSDIQTLGRESTHGFASQFYASESRERASAANGQVRSWSHLSVENTTPLFRKDLTDGERLGLQWFLSEVISHEAMHAFYGAFYLYKSPRDKEPPFEPFFADDPVAELGFVWEHHMIEGVGGPMVHHKGKKDGTVVCPLAFTIREGWPTFLDASAMPILNSPPLCSEDRRFPIYVLLVSAAGLGFL
ncbi:hypothetical protein B0O99DRAFT_672858 [Bisporella sp. PMI_857]|nr:hypothetical protein B0O99DRAFT_672858 [Bisporella sp. PMI_857]